MAITSLSLWATEAAASFPSTVILELVPTGLFPLRLTVSAGCAPLTEEERFTGTGAAVMQALRGAESRVRFLPATGRWIAVNTGFQLVRTLHFVRAEKHGRLP